MTSKMMTEPATPNFQRVDGGRFFNHDELTTELDYAGLEARLAQSAGVPQEVIDAAQAGTLTAEQQALLAAAAFGSPTGRRGDTNVPDTDRPLTRQQAIDELRRNRQRFGGLQGMRQREEAARRRREENPPETFEIDWENRERWLAPYNGDTVEYQIAEMEDQHLWQTVIWLVRSVDDLYAQYMVPSTQVPLALASRRWLRDRIVFRALLQESLRRQMSFPDDVYHYLHQYVLNRTTALPDYQPWADPAARQRQAELQNFLDEDVEPPEDYGKEYRPIDID